MNLIKKHLLFVALLVQFLSFSQLYNETELMANNVKEVKITAREYSNGKVIKEVINKDIVNEYGKSIEFITYKSDGKINRSIKSYYSDGGKTKIDTTFRDNGDIKYLKIFTKNIKNRTISHFQIVPPNDTLVSQIWYRNSENQDSILVNRIKSNRYISKKWEYNEEGILKQTTSYNSDSSLRSIEKVKLENNGKCKVYLDENGKKREKQCFDKGKETTYFFSDDSGYLYGIALKSKNKGKKVVRRDNKGLIETIIYFDKKESILSEIIYEYF